MERVIKNMGFNVIPTEVGTRKGNWCSPQYNFEIHVRNAQKDFAEYANQEKEKWKT